MAESSFPTLPVSGVTIPATQLTVSALAYSRAHTSPSTVNHCLRSMAFALLLARKLPPFQGIDPETVVISTLLHDMGWATTKALLSPDKRFEVDGANIARDFLTAEASQGKEHAHSPGPTLDQHRTQLIWDAIALHTTPSIALHKEPEVAVTGLGILADFLGPHHPSGAITVEEYREVVRAFPRLDFLEELPKIMCGLCIEKPETTYDNFVGDFGCEYVEGYREKWEKSRMPGMLMGGLERCKEYET